MNKLPQRWFVQTRWTLRRRWNFLEYSYAQEFNRDYTAEDVKAMLDNIYERHFI